MCMTSFWQGTRFQLIYVDIRSFMRFQFLVVVTGVPGESPQKGLHERAYITAWCKKLALVLFADRTIAHQWENLEASTIGNLSQRSMCPDLAGKRI